MKKVFLNVLLFMGLFFISCSNENEINEQFSVQSDSTILQRINSNSYFNNYDFELIGIEHNKGLEAIYSQLESFDFLNSSQNDLYNEIFEETQNFLLNNNNFDKLDSDLLSQLKPSVSSSNLITDMKNNLFSELTSNFLKEEVNKIENIFNDFKTIENYNSTSVIRDIRLIEENINKSEIVFNDKEYVAVRAFISTSIHSLNYWEANINKWYELNPNSNQTFGRGWGWFKNAIGNMAVADAYGAGVGLVVGFVSSIASGPGVLVGTAAGAVGYGMNASALQGVRELHNSL
jgi:hypothetical protein